MDSWPGFLGKHLSDPYDLSFQDAMQRAVPPCHHPICHQRDKRVGVGACTPTYSFLFFCYNTQYFFTVMTHNDEGYSLRHFIAYLMQ